MPSRGEIVDRGMARGAHEADRDPLERRAGRGQQQVGAGRAEPDDDDTRLHRHPAYRRTTAFRPVRRAVVVVVGAVVLARGARVCCFGAVTS